MSEVRIDAPGAGQWIMKRAQGYFRAGWDHAFSSHRKDGRILGGIALVGYLDASMSVHMAGDDTHWFSRQLAWLAFDYAFRQLRCRKLLAPVRSDNYAALAADLRGGWQVETILRDVFNPRETEFGLGGEHFIILVMTEKTCPWLNYQPKQWRSNRSEAA